MMSRVVHKRWRWQLDLSPAGHPALTCRVKWRRPRLRFCSQATTLGWRGVISTVGHMLGCAVILCHLRHTRGTGPAL